MSDYNDIFIRNTLGETNSLPRDGSDTDSPDIIPWGTAEARDPVTTFASASSYGTNPGKKVVYDSQNYIYIRGKNDNSDLVAGTVSLYYAHRTQLSNPNAWQRLSTKNGNNTSSAAADAGDVAVASDPFVWSPSEPPAANPYLLIAVIATPDHSNPVPDYINDPETFATWQANQGGVAARTISVPAPPQPKTVYALEAYVDLNNDDELKAQFDLQWTGATPGDKVSLTTDTSSTSGPIGFSNFDITAANQSTGTQATVPVQYSTVVSCTYQTSPNGSVASPTLKLVVSTAPSSGGGGGPGSHDIGNVSFTKFASFTLQPD